MLLSALTNRNIINNRISPATPWFSNRSARLSNGVGFGGLGSDWSDGTGGITDPTTGASTWDVNKIVDLMQKGIIAMNAQQVFQLNLDRLQRGLSPIPTQYAAPTVNFGVAGISPTMMLLGAGVLLMLLMKR